MTLEKTDIPVPTETPKLPKNKIEREFAQRVIVVLDCAPLEIVRVGKGPDSRHHLLNSDDHQNVLRKHNKDLSEYRPDITHQCLLALLDSPLNKAGKLQVYIRTQRGVLIEINPHTRIPRTFTRFAGLMVQLLHKLSIRAVGSNEKLLNVIRNPITDHLPVKCRKIAMSGDAEAIRLSDYVKTLSPDEPVVFFVGAMAHGDDNFEFAETKISVSEFPLAAATVCSKICQAYEDLWDIL